MKFKIRKYAGGGGFMASIYQPVTTSNKSSSRVALAAALLGGAGVGGGTSSGSSKSGSNSGQLTEKDLYTKLGSIDGLQSDVSAVISKIQNDMSQQSLLDPLGTGSSSSIANKYLENLNYLNQVKQNKDAFNKSYALANSKNSIAEAAVTSNGGVVVKDASDKIKIVSPEEYLKNQKNYILQTNGNLLAERRENPQYKFNNNLLDIVNNSTSTKEISDTINAFTSSLGSSENTLSGYSVKDQKQIQGGLEILKAAADKYGEQTVMNALNFDGVYKNKVFTSDQLQQAKAAISAIYNMLPNNQKTLLKLKSNGTESGVIQQITQIVSSKTTNKFNFDTDFQPDLNPDGTKKDTDKSKTGEEESNFYSNIIKERGGTPITLQINKGSNAQMSITGTNYGNILGSDKNTIPETSLYNVMNSGLSGIITNTNSITFGNQKINSGQWKDIMYDNSGGTSAHLPKKADGSVDLEILDEYESCVKAAQRATKNNPDRYDQVLGKYLMNNSKLMHLVDQRTGRENPKMFQQYFIINAYAVDRDGSIIKNPNSKYFQKIKDPDDQLVKRIQKGLTDDAKNPYTIDVDNWYDFNGHDDIYQGTVYMPITYNNLQAITASKGSTKNGKLEDYKAQIMQKRINANTSSASVLNN